MWYTKKRLFSLFPYAGSVEMLGSSDPPSTPLLLDLSSNTGSLLVVRIPVERLLEFGTFVVLMGISNVATVNSKIDFYVACQSWHISTYILDA
jgi:hypothetical protein